MKRQSTTSSLLRRLNRSAAVDLIRTEGVISPSSLAERLNISLPTVMRVIEDLIAEDLVAYDGFDETSRGRPRARVKFRGAAHAIIGIEAGKGEFYGAVANLEGLVQTEAVLLADGGGDEADRVEGVASDRADVGDGDRTGPGDDPGDEVSGDLVLLGDDRAGHDPLGQFRPRRVLSPTLPPRCPRA